MLQRLCFNKMKDPPYITIRLWANYRYKRITCDLCGSFDEPDW